MGPNYCLCACTSLDNQTPQDRIGACSFRSRSLFWGFKWNERSNNPEKNSNKGYRSEPQYIL